jgi:hypothetical protein
MDLPFRKRFAFDVFNEGITRLHEACETVIAGND